MKNYFTFQNPTGMAVIFLLGIFIIDLHAPLQIAVGILYILCFFLICNQNRKTIIGFTIVMFLLLPAKFIIFYDSETSYLIYINRVLATSAILIIAIQSLKYRKMVDSRNLERVKYQKQLEQMLIITSHKVRKPLASFLGLLNDFESDKLTAAAQEAIIINLKRNASDLDTFINELTVFMREIKDEKPSV